MAYGYNAPLHVYSVNKKSDDGMPEQMNTVYKGLPEPYRRSRCSP